MFQLNLIQLETHIYLFTFKQISNATKWNTNRNGRVHHEKQQQRRWWLQFAWDSFSFIKNVVVVTTYLDALIVRIRYTFYASLNKQISLTLSLSEERSWKLKKAFLESFIHVYSDWKWFLIFFMCHGNVTNASRNFKRAGKQINNKSRDDHCLCDFICSMTLSGYSIDVWDVSNIKDVRHISNIWYKSKNLDLIIPRHVFLLIISFSLPDRQYFCY